VQLAGQLGERPAVSQPVLRREFRVDQPAAAARLYITALGLYEARLNGQRVGDAVLAPGWTDYTQRIPYQAYDVTGLLRPGDNVLGVIAADGWAAGFFGFDAKRAGRHYAEAPELLAELVLRLADGTYSSVRGPVASGWRRDDGWFTFALELPPNVTASVRIPSDDPAAVRDRAGSGPVSVAGYPGAPGATEAVFAAGPGSHEFTGPALTGLLSLSNG
jgi:alpha-L-rhamnosidase